MRGPQVIEKKLNPLQCNPKRKFFFPNTPLGKAPPGAWGKPHGNLPRSPGVTGVFFVASEGPTSGLWHNKREIPGAPKKEPCPKEKFLGKPPFPLRPEEG